jgi:hypothetical protein
MRENMGRNVLTSTTLTQALSTFAVAFSGSLTSYSTKLYSMCIYPVFNSKILILTLGS